jgi:hypothetical protein
VAFTIDDTLGLAQQAYTDALAHLVTWRARYADGTLIDANGEYPKFTLPDGTNVDWPAYEAHLQQQVKESAEQVALAITLANMTAPFEMRTESGV